MADFSGLASVLHMHHQDVSKENRVNKTRKKSLDLQSESSTRVNPKLIQILKDNQDEFLNEEKTTQLDCIINARLEPSNILSKSKLVIKI
jgi:hypothetical protein